jgi:non-lysosomal glucosylceramidase
VARKKHSRINRRTFLKNFSAGAATLAGTAALPPLAPAATPQGLDIPPTAGARSDRIVYRGESLRAVAMPLGGIGTGSIALAGDGGLRQWQIGHTVDHLAHVPHSFFAVWAVGEDRPSMARVLQSSALYDPGDFKPPVTSNDHVVPPESRKLLERLPGVKGLEYSGEYPFAQIRYTDPELPLEVSLEAYSPFIPLDAKDSGIPAIIFEFRLRNAGTRPVWASVLSTLQNLVGWDGHSPISGVENFAYGSNHNTLEKAPGLTSILMSNPHLPEEFPFNGQLALAAMSENASYITQWDDLDLLWRDFSDDGNLSNDQGVNTSLSGRTWNGALAMPVELRAGEESSIVFVLAWYFPNRYVTWNQPALSIDDKKTRFWLGTMYSNWFASAGEVARYVCDNYPRLAGETRRWRDTFLDFAL